MGLESSMWIGITGLNTSAEQMTTIGNNLANVDTVGYKSQNMNFEDMVYANTTTGAGVGQLGQGVRVENIESNFAQGTFQTTNNPTDMAISGSGFFTVKDQNTQAIYYTRAGNFTLDKSGNLVNPQGDVVQGWAVDNNALHLEEANGQSVTQVPTKGTLTNIQLNTLSLAAQSTSSVSLSSNLDTAAKPGSSNSTNPFFGMFENYNYNPSSPNTAPLSSTAFDFQNTISVYDQKGGAHTLSVYYDKVSDVGGKEYWEYMVTVPPGDDGRMFDINGTETLMNSNSKAGVLMMGSLTFNSSGTLTNETAYTLNSSALSNPVSNLSDWSLARISSSGYPVFTANFQSVSGASTSYASNAVSMSLNLGLKSGSTTWNTTATTANMLGLSHLSNASALQGFNPSTLTLNNSATTNYNTSSAILAEDQDGFPPGQLQSVSVDANGVLSGVFTNGQTQQLWVVGLASFASPWGLTRDGSNLYSATQASGSPLYGRANTGLLGSIDSDALEESNVDMAAQMVQMIQTQRGYEASSKIITTADQLIQETLALKT